MRQIYKKICLLLVGLLAFACNDDGNVTVVIEDGQPVVRTMVIGKWMPTHWRWVNNSTGEIVKEGDIDAGSDNGYIWEFFEDGTFSYSDGESSIGELVGWSTDENSYTIYIDGEEWTVILLTENLMILYRDSNADDEDAPADSSYYLEFDRVDESSSGGDDDQQSDYGALDHIASITYSTVYVGGSTSSETVYSFNYDNDGKILDWEEKYGNSSSVAAYVYDDDNVYVSSDGNYIGELNADGYVETVRYRANSTADWRIRATISYNSDGQMTAYTSTYSNSDNTYTYTYTYANGNRISSMDETYTYTDIKNTTYPDLNCFITSTTTLFIFEPFGLMGQSSKNMVQRLDIEDADAYYTYEYMYDNQGRISQILCHAINKFDDGWLNTTTYDITYVD